MEPGDLITSTLVVVSNDAFLRDVKKVGDAPLEKPPQETSGARSGFELLRPGEAVPDAEFVHGDLSGNVEDDPRGRVELVQGVRGGPPGGDGDVDRLGRLPCPDQAHVHVLLLAQVAGVAPHGGRPAVHREDKGPVAELRHVVQDATQIGELHASVTIGAGAGNRRMEEATRPCIVVGVSS